MNTITYEEFEKVDLRSGTIVKAEPFLKARKPAYKILVDFGPEIGVKQTSAQVHYRYFRIHYTQVTFLISTRRTRD